MTKMTKKILIATGAIALLGLGGGYLALRVLVSDDHVRTQLAARLSEATGQPVRIERAHLVFTPKIGIELSQVQIGEPARLSADAMRLVTGLRPLLRRRIEGAELVVDGGRVELPLPAAPGGAPVVEEPVRADESATGGMTLVSIDTIALRDFRVTAGSHKVVVDLDTTLAGERLEIRQLRARMDAAVVEGTGSVEGFASPVVTLDLTASQLDLDALTSLLGALAASSETRLATGAGARRPSGEGKGRAQPAAGSLPEMAVSLTASRGRLGGASFSDLKARLKAAGRAIHVDPLTVVTFGGRCSGSLDVDLGRSVPSFAGRVTMDGIDMAEVLSYAGKDGMMTGSLSGTMNVRGHGGDTSSLVRRLDGAGRVLVKDGTVRHLDLVGSVVRALGRPGEAPAGSGEAFDTLGGHFVLNDGVMQSSDLTFDSRDVDLDGAGRLLLTEGTLNVRANLRLSEELTGRMGRDGARLTSENGRMIVPAVLSGPVDAPQVTVDVNAMARRAAAEEAKKQIGRGLNRLLKKKPGGGDHR